MRVARDRVPGQQLKQIAADFGISGVVSDELVEGRRRRRRVRPGVTEA